MYSAQALRKCLGSLGLSFVLVLVAGYPVVSSAVEGDADEAVRDRQMELCRRYYEGVYQARQAALDRLTDPGLGISMPADFTSTSCLKRLMNPRLLDALFNAPSGSAILKTLLSKAVSTACNAVESHWNAMLGQVRSGVYRAIPDFDGVGYDIIREANGGRDIIDVRSGSGGVTVRGPDGRVVGTTGNVLDPLREGLNEAVDEVNRAVDRGVGRAGRAIDNAAGGVTSPSSGSGGDPYRSYSPGAGGSSPPGRSGVDTPYRSYAR